MFVSDLEILDTAGFCQLQAKVTLQRFPRSPFTLWYRVPTEFASCLSETRGDGFLAALLPAAMAADEALHLDAPVSARLLKTVDKIQKIYAKWFPGLFRVTVDAPVAPVEEAKTDCIAPAGLFFSLGADSFYSLIKNDQEISPQEYKLTHLVFVRGFDIDLDESSDRFHADVLASARMVAERFEKTVVPVATNLRVFADKIVSWRTYHGAALASVALVLGRFFSHVCIASSCDYQHLYPLGSHPELDPLWTTEKTRIIHDGCEENRLGKIARISENRTAMDQLRVCFRNPDHAYNCGKCRKCTLSMLALHVLGVLPKCNTLPKSIDLGAVERLVMPPEKRYRLEEFIAKLGPSRTDRALKKALETALASSDNRSGETESQMNRSRSWYAQRRAVAEEVSRILESRAPLILADEGHFRADIPDNSKLIPFLERDGQFWGRPLNSEVAIRELERLRDAGAEHIVFASTTFWWLDYYVELNEYLRSRYPCIRENDDVVAFRLVHDE